MANAERQSPNTAATGVLRYPGVQPFEDSADHRQIFLGRDDEKYELLQLVLAERLVTMFSRSGLGKSSLINAGLLEPLRERDHFPVVVRVSGAGATPLDSLYSGIQAAVDQAQSEGKIEFEPEVANWNKASLWHFFKSFEVWRDDKLLSPVLIIDQFEELFTLHDFAARRRLIRELADLVRGIRPRDVSDPQGPKFSSTPPAIKVVLVLREDFYGNLQELRDTIPSIYKAPFRLTSLTRDQARQAIVGPAALEGEQFLTPPFSWEDQALRHVLDFLSEQQLGEGQTRIGEEVEPFQLQLVCQYVENLAREQGLKQITNTALGGDEALRSVLSGFYEDTLNRICKQFPKDRGLRSRLENLCEQGFVTARGRRLLREESMILEDDGVGPDVLRKMVEMRLIRNEPRIGDNYYELTHDTLIEPIQQARRRRAEREEKRVRQRRIRIGAALGGVAALLIAGIGYNEYDKAEERARIEAERQQAEIERQQQAAARQEEEIARQHAEAERQERLKQEAQLALEEKRRQQQALQEAREKIVALRDEALATLDDRLETARVGVAGAESAYTASINERRNSAETKAASLREARIYEREARDGEYHADAVQIVEALEAEIAAEREKVRTQRRFLLQRIAIAALLQDVRDKLAQDLEEILRDLDALDIAAADTSDFDAFVQRAEETIQRGRGELAQVEQDGGIDVADLRLDPATQLTLELTDLEFSEADAIISDAELAASYRRLADRFQTILVLEESAEQYTLIEDKIALYGNSAQAYQDLRLGIEGRSLCEQQDLLNNYGPARAFGTEFEYRQAELRKLAEFAAGAPVVVTAKNFITTTGQRATDAKTTYGDDERVWVRAWFRAPGRSRVIVRRVQLAPSEDPNEPPTVVRTRDISTFEPGKTGRNILTGVHVGYRQYTWTTPMPGTYELQLWYRGSVLLCRTRFEVEE